MKKKDLTELGQTNTLGTLVARMSVRRALRTVRHINHRSAFVIGIELPNDQDMGEYEHAIRLELSRRRFGYRWGPLAPEFHRFYEEVKPPTSSKKSCPPSGSLERAIEVNPNLVCIGTPEHPIPNAAENFLELRLRISPSATHIQAAFWVFHGLRLSLDECESLLEYGLHQISIAFRGNRPLTESKALLNALAAAAKGADRPEPSNILPLQDLHGYGEAGSWGAELAEDLKAWRAGQISWKDVDRGVLLHGKPGTGKTTFARSLAHTCKAQFVECSLAKAQAKGHLGDMLADLIKTFENAKKHAPSILFIDEFDTLGCRVSLSPQHADYSRKVISALLELMDGAVTREGVVVVGACNHLSMVDSAFLRPGRLDRMIEIPPPDFRARTHILTQHLETTLTTAALREIGIRTEGWTGADLEQLARDAKRSARRSKQVLDACHVLEVVGNSQVEITPGQLKRRAIHEAGHVLAAYLLQGVTAVEASVLDFTPTNSAGHPVSGGKTVLPIDNATEGTREAYLDRIAVSLAGYAAEKVLLKSPSDGSGGADGSDLARATSLAVHLIGATGLGGSLLYRFTKGSQELDSALLRERQIRRSCEKILQSQLKKLLRVFERHSSTLTALAEELARNGKLSRTDISQIVERPNSTILKQSLTTT